MASRLFAFKAGSPMSEQQAIYWTNERRKLSDLVPWPRNPRQIKIDQAQRLVESLDEFNQVETFAIGPQNEVYNGHQRLAAWADKYGPDLEIDVRVSSRPLSEKEREKLTIFLHKGAAGEWNFDVLSEWDVPDLLKWGFKAYELGIAGDAIDPNEEWEGMPEFEQEGIKPIKELTVKFLTEADFNTFRELIDQNISIESHRSIWYPAQNWEQTSAKIAYVNEP